MMNARIFGRRLILKKWQGQERIHWIQDKSSLSNQTTNFSLKNSDWKYIFFVRKKRLHIQNLMQFRGRHVRSSFRSTPLQGILEFIHRYSTYHVLEEWSEKISAFSFAVFFSFTFTVYILKILKNSSSKLSLCFFLNEYWDAWILFSYLWRTYFQSSQANNRPASGDVVESGCAVMRGQLLNCSMIITKQCTRGFGRLRPRVTSSSIINNYN